MVLLTLGCAAAVVLAGAIIFRARTRPRPREFAPVVELAQARSRRPEPWPRTSPRITPVTTDSRRTAAAPPLGPALSARSPYAAPLLRAGRITLPDDTADLPIRFRSTSPAGRGLV